MTSREACCRLLQLKKNVQDDNEPGSSLSFSIAKEKTIKDNDKPGSQLIVIFYN
jgi:hypothetical protein